MNFSKGWYQFNIEFNLTGTTKDIIIGCMNNGSTNGSIIYMDDFRFHPVDADFVSYVYDQGTGERVAELDSQNFYTRYVYDSEGVKINSYREILNKPAESIQSGLQYNFKD